MGKKKTDNFSKENNDKNKSQPDKLVHYQSIVNWAHKEIENVRTVYKWLAGSLAIILSTAIAAATFLTYSTIHDLKSDLDSKVDDLAKKVENRVNDEFKKENIQSLVKKSAKERIDEVADNIIKTHVNERINKVITKFEKRLANSDVRLTSLENKLGEKFAETEKSLIRLESEALVELRETAKYLMTVSAAQNDDRKAFDQLEKWLLDKNSPFSENAKQAWEKILDIHAQPWYTSGYKVPWKEGIDPSKLSISELRSFYNDVPATVRLALVEYIWERSDLPKKERMQFLVEVLKNDSSLKVVEYAGRFFTQESGQQLKPLAVKALLDWWDENREKIQ
ncbi:MAG: hypothetical protein IIA61_01745 [Candidatus Marinimicrobia bacterium]|nr:hypothetical protein [Candidatus Neomarinimicrobiota bacterium]